MNKKTHIIFDFDGTLADSERVLIESLEALKLPQLAHIQRSDIQALKKLGMRQALKQLSIPLYKLPGLVSVAQREMATRTSSIALFPDCEKTLHELKSKQFSLGILTSNSLPVVEAVLQRYDLVSVFDFIHSEKNVFGKDKPLAKILGQKKLSLQEVVYVGDEVRDFEACQKVGVEMIGVGWGYNTAESLYNAGIKHVVNSFDELALTLAV